MSTLAILLLIAVAQTGGETAPDLDQLLAERNGRDGQLVCKWVRRENSRIKTRECRTEREWRQIRERSQEFMSRRINF